MKFPKARSGSKMVGTIINTPTVSTTTGVKGKRKVAVASKVMPSRVSKKVNRFGISNLKKNYDGKGY
mgnify:CR=1 FL=1